MSSMKYCPLCMNTGIDINNNICRCRQKDTFSADAVTCLDVPAQYIGITFSSVLVAADIGEAYRNKLQAIHDEITTLKWAYRNMALCSPAGHSKTILAYSCMQRLFRRNVTVFPLLDLFEIQRISADMDYCRKPLYDIGEPERLYTVPYLFVRVPTAVSYDTYDIMSLLLDRRTRRGGSTIFLFNGMWGNLTCLDKRGVITNLQGDGSGCSMEVSSWHTGEVK